jgi:hypothetical protein
MIEVGHSVGHRLIEDQVLHENRTLLDMCKNLDSPCAPTRPGPMLVSLPLH